MDDKDRVNATDTFVAHDRLRNKTNLLESLARLSPDDTTNRIKVREAMAILEDATEGTTVLHRCQPKAARVSWMKRLVNWFKSK